MYIGWEDRTPVLMGKILENEKLEDGGIATIILR